MSAPEFPIGFVDVSKTGGYYVLGKCGAWHRVTQAERLECDCEAGRNGSEICWHRRQVRDLVRKLDHERRRPTAPPNIGALVD